MSINLGNITNISYMFKNCSTINTIPFFTNTICIEIHGCKYYYTYPINSKNLELLEESLNYDIRIIKMQIKLLSDSNIKDKLSKLNDLGVEDLYEDKYKLFVNIESDDDNNTLIVFSKPMNFDYKGTKDLLNIKVKFSLGSILINCIEVEFNNGDKININIEDDIEYIKNKILMNIYI